MSIQSINSNDLKQLIDDDNVCLIDVRESVEHQSFHIKGSHHFPLSQITAKHVPQTDKKVVIYCLKGMRGDKACKKIAEEFEGDIFNLEGGIEAWKNRGFDVVKGEKNHFPLDRQVQITIGFSVLASVLASLFVNSNFAWIAAFFGAGLLFAGLSGTCGLALVLAKMPWNKAT